MIDTQTDIVNIPFKLTSSCANPKDVNYEVLPFFKEIIRYPIGHADNGRINEINYYRNQDFNNGTYSDLILKEKYTYTDVNDILAIRQVDTVYYILNVDDNDNSLVTGFTKTKYKTFLTDEGLIEAIREGKERRKYLIDKAQAYLLQTYTLKNDLNNVIKQWNVLSTEISGYIESKNDDELFQKINTNNLFTAEEKQIIINILTY